MSNAGFNAGGTIAVNGFAFGGTVQPLLEIRKMLGGLIFLSGLNQGNHFFLGVTSSLQEDAINLAAAKCGAGLFGGRGSVSHKPKECLKHRFPVNP